MASTKQMIIVGGPNGSGKTTFVSSVLQSRAGEYVGADAIAAELNPDQPEATAIQAGRLFVERLNDRIDRGEHIVVESTLSGRSLLNHIERALDLGYQVLVMFVFLDSAEMSIARVRQRVSRGGHHVPDDDVRRRYTRSLRNFWQKYRFAVDQWVLHHNSGEECVAVAMGRADNFVVYNDETMQGFLDVAEGGADDSTR